MIFVPVTRRTADELCSGQVAGPVQGFGATAPMLAAHGLDGVRDEDDAAFTAQAYAMTSGLLRGLWPDGARVVLAVETDGVLDGGGQLGEVTVSGFGWPQVRAVFSDGPRPDPRSCEAVTGAAAAVHGSPLEEAVDAVQVETLLQRHDLLWHVPDERW